MKFGDLEGVPHPDPYRGLMINHGYYPLTSSGMILQDTSHRQWMHQAWGLGIPRCTKKNISQSMSIHDRCEHSGKKLPQQLYKTSNIWKKTMFSELHRPHKNIIRSSETTRIPKDAGNKRPKKPGFARSNPTLLVRKMGFFEFINILLDRET